MTKNKPWGVSFPPKTHSNFSRYDGEVPLIGKRVVAGDDSADEDKTRGLASLSKLKLARAYKAEKRRVTRQEKKERRGEVRLALEEEERRVVEVGREGDQTWTEIERLQFATETGSLLKWLRYQRVSPRRTETEFEAAVRDYRRKQRLIEEKGMRLEKAEGTKLMRLLAQIHGLEESVTRLANRLFGMVCRLMGFNTPSEFPYVKSEFDAGMEAAFGSLDREGSGVFEYRGISQEVRTTEGANRVFSLYLGRKVFCPVSLSKKREGLEKFYERVCKRRPSTPNTPIMLHYFRVLVRLLFDELKEGESFTAPVHDSGCLELSKSKGGKREVYWGEVAGNPTPSAYTVVPEAIYSGGKIRVITKDSASNLRFAWLNEYMNRRVQRNRWSIFGRTVSDWIEKNPDFAVQKKGYKFLSGDLEAATDTFMPEFAEIAFQRLQEVFKGTDRALSDEDIETMKSFTTRATFPLPGKVQEAGQLMGSILSFPILCIVSFAAATWRSPLMGKLCALVDLGKIKKGQLLLRRYGEVGINGDDMVGRVADGGSRWMEGVAAVGGIASRGKSLLCDHAFTVNSEIWKVGATVNDLGKPASIRPTLLCALAEDDRKCANKDWLEYVRSPLLSRPAKDYFCVDRALRPYLPRRMGGCEVEQDFDRALPDIVAWKQAERDYYGVPKETVRPERAWAGYEDPFAESKSVKVVITRTAYEAYQKFRFGESRPQWVRGGLSLGQMFQNIRRKGRGVDLSLLGHGEREELRRWYEREWSLSAQDKRLTKIPLECAQVLGGCEFRQQSSEFAKILPNTTFETILRRQREESGCSMGAGGFRLPISERNEKRIAARGKLMMSSSPFMQGNSSYWVDKAFRPPETLRVQRPNPATVLTSSQCDERIEVEENQVGTSMQDLSSID